MLTSVAGFPRIGDRRELKFASEGYLSGKISKDELRKAAAAIRAQNWKFLKDSGISLIPSNDFSFYSRVADAAAALGFIPERFREEGLTGEDLQFALGRGFNGKNGPAEPLSMKKWFDTNLHYLVPEFDDTSVITSDCTKAAGEFNEARDLGINTVPTLIGPFTLLKLTEFTGKRGIEDVADETAEAYASILARLAGHFAEYVAFEEPSLVRDLTEEDRALFERLYNIVLKRKGSAKVILQTYFGDVRDAWSEICRLPFDAVGLDFVKGKKTLELVEKNGFPRDRLLIAGVVDGRNIWRTRYDDAAAILGKLSELGLNAAVSASCSLVHVPVTVKSETKLSQDVLRWFSFAREKVQEIAEIAAVASGAEGSDKALSANRKLFATERVKRNDAVRQAVASLKEEDFRRVPAFAERERIQKARFGLPLLPTTTIGSFPQTAEVRALRKKLRTGEIGKAEYDESIKALIKRIIGFQEEIGLDVLVHGEYERNDMVEYFGERLDGFLFTENGWVLSYGTRCVKPPVIFGDVSRKSPITVDTSVYAQSLTKKPVKGMLTGPVTIYNWSFPRNDIPEKEVIYELALAVRGEVLDLEKAGISIIQIDEAALKEKLPLRKEDWDRDYLSFAIPSFRLVTSGVRPETQIHTHMCYSEFSDIIKSIDDMDADVISFEASRGKLEILDSLKENNFRTEAGPGVYDIHSPLVPSVEEIKTRIRLILEKLPAEKVWINPDCGLKTRHEEEAFPSLRNLVEAAREIRAELGK